MFIITNTQEVLVGKPGAIYPVCKAYLSAENEWTVTKPAKEFASIEDARRFLEREGLAEGRHEDVESNRVNTITIEGT